MNTLYKNKSIIDGSGLFAGKSFKKGEVVGYIHGPIHVFKIFTPSISKRMLDWIGVGRYSWIDTSKSDFRFINHSCKPNVAIVTKRKVIALSNIKANSEIAMDYSLTEAEPEWKINCYCGNSNCRKIIGPIYKLNKKVFNEYLPNIPTNFQKIYRIENK